jgi:branched-chain amino acid transport system substrate-binding protein
VTGPDPNALEIEPGIRMKLDEVGWQVAGRKIELIVEDDAFDPTLSVEKAKKLVGVDKVDVIFGSLLVSCSLAVSSYLTPYKIPQFTFVEMPPEGYLMGGRNVFCLNGQQRGVTQYLGAYAYNTLGYKTAAVLNQDFVAGEELSQGFINGFQGAGGQVIQRQRVAMGTMDYAPYVTAIKKADCVAFWLLPEESMRFMPLYFGSNLGMPLMLIHGSFPNGMLQAVGDSTLGMLSVHRWCETLDYPLNKQWTAAFTEATGKAPEYLGISGYEIASVFLAAVQATGGDTTPEVINDAIRKVKIDLPSGMTSFTDDGVGIGDLHILQAQKVGGNVVWESIFTYNQVPYVEGIMGQ